MSGVEGRVDTLEVDVKDLRMQQGDHSDRIKKLERGQIKMSVQMSNLQTSLKMMEVEVKATINHTFNVLLRDALNSVPGRVSIWYGGITVALAVAAFLASHFIK